MRLLRLSNSDDLNTRIPPELRAANIIKALLEEHVREPVEVETRLLWPNSTLPDVVEKWMRAFEPDFVSLRTSSYWVTWESVPRLMRGRFGPVGRAAAGLGKRSARTPWLAENALYRGLRGFALKTVGGETPFTVPEALGGLDAVFKRILAVQEDIPMVVRAPNAPFNSSGTAAGARRSAKRHAEFVAGAKQLAKKYHAEWMPFPANAYGHDPSVVVGDGIHKNEAGQRDLAIAEAAAIAAMVKRL